MKPSEIIELSTDDIREKIDNEQLTLTKMKLSHAVSPLESPAKLGEAKKTIARLQTELRKRELAETK